MARPKKKLFFESDIPCDLIQKNEWLYNFHLNSEKLVKYILKNGAQNTAYHTTVSCLTGLRTYLLTNEIPYSPEAAVQWFRDTGPYPKGYQSVLYRFEDLYLYGSVQPVHAFPHALSYEKKLTEPWKGILTEFRKTSVLSVNSEIQVKNCVSRFLYRLQEWGISSPSQITFGLLEDYCQTECHSSAHSYSRYIYAIGDILLFMADRGLCHHGLGWYPYYRMHQRIFSIDDFTVKQIELLENTKEEASVFQTEEYAVIVEDFLAEYMKSGYSKTQCKAAHYTLHNLLLFMEMHGYGYHQTVADIWLEHEKLFHKGDGWKMARRILRLFDIYIKRKTLLCFLQALFGKKCRNFLAKIASPNWRKLHSFWMVN